MIQPGIYRSQLSFEQGFTRIPNTWLRDERIGFRAKGLLAYLLSHEIGYTITLAQIERETGDGRHAIRTAIDELEEAGYLQTKRTHDERGWNAGLAWLLQDPNPKCENPTLENPTLENRPALEENLNKKNTKKETLVHFEEFWEVYPRKVGKGAAMRAFAKAVEETPASDLVEGARRLANDPNLPPKEFVPHAATWLNRDGWLDEPYPERQLTPGELKLREVEALAERKRRDAEAQERERQERRRIEEEAKANPPEKCEHGKIVVLGNCRECRR